MRSVVHIPLHFTLSYLTDGHGSTEGTCLCTFFAGLSVCRGWSPASRAWCSRHALARCSLPRREKEYRLTSFAVPQWTERAHLSDSTPRDLGHPA